MIDPTNPTDRVIRTAGQATIGGIVAGVLVAFGVVTEAQGIAVAPLVTLLASLAQNWRGCRCQEGRRRLTARLGRPSRRCE